MRVAISVPPFLNPLVTSYAAALLCECTKKLGHSVEFKAGYMTAAENALRAGLEWGRWKSFMNDPFIGDLATLPLLRDWDSSYVDERNEAVARFGSSDCDELVTAALSSWIDEEADSLRGVDILAISATHYALAPGIALAQRIKELSPCTYVVLGGYFGSPLAAQGVWDQHKDYIDCVVYGEAEARWPEILESQPKGLFLGRTAALPKDRVSQESLLSEVARRPWIRKRLTASLEFSRGCYWDKCDFCNFNVGYGGGFRERDPEVLLGEIEALQEWGVSKYQLLDTSVSVRLGRYLDSNDINLDLQMFCEIRADFRMRDFRALKRFGRLAVQIGIESLSDSHLQMMEKNASVTDNVRCLRICRDLSIPVTWGIFVAHPNETREQLRQTLRAMSVMHHLPPPKYVTHCEVRPGSSLWRQEIDSGLSAVQFPYRCFDPYLKSARYFAELLPAIRTGQNPIDLEMIQEIELEVEKWKAEYGTASRVLDLSSGVLTIISTEGSEMRDVPDVVVERIRQRFHQESIVLDADISAQAIESGVAVLVADDKAVVVADLQ